MDLKHIIINNYYNSRSENINIFICNIVYAFIRINRKKERTQNLVYYNILTFSIIKFDIMFVSFNFLK